MKTISVNLTKNYTCEISIDDQIYFLLQPFPSNCGAYIFSGFGYSDSFGSKIFSLRKTGVLEEGLRVGILCAIIKLIRHDKIMETYGQRNVVVLSDYVDGPLDVLFKGLFKSKKWTEESNMGYNFNTGNMLVIRHFSIEDLYTELDNKTTVPYKINFHIH